MLSETVEFYVNFSHVIGESTKLFMQVQLGLSSNSCSFSVCVVRMCLVNGSVMGVDVFRVDGGVMPFLNDSPARLADICGPREHRLVFCSNTVR